MKRLNRQSAILRTLSSLAFGATCLVGIPSIYAQQPLHGYYQSAPISNGLPMVSGCSSCQVGPSIGQHFGYPSPEAGTPVQVANEYYNQTISSYSAPIYGIPQSHILSSPGFQNLDGQPSYNVPGSAYPTIQYPAVSIPLSDSPIGVLEYQMSRLRAVQNPAVGTNYGPTIQSEVIFAEPILSSPNDVNFGKPESTADASAKLRDELERSQLEVAHLQTVVAELKVELKDANQRADSTLRASKATKRNDAAQLQQAALATKLAATEAAKLASEQQVAELREVVGVLSADKNALEERAAKQLAMLEDLNNALLEGKAKVVDLIKTLASERASTNENRKALEQTLKEQVQVNYDLKMRLDKQSLMAHAAKRQQAKVAEELGKSRAVAQAKLEQANAKAQAEIQEAKTLQKELKREIARVSKMKSAKANEERELKMLRLKDIDLRKDDAKKMSKKDVVGKQAENKLKEKNKDAPKKYNAEAQIDKLSRSMERQITQAENEVNDKLDAQLKDLSKEGIGRDHPRAKAKIKATRKELDAKLQKIKDRVLERIQRIRKEASRRNASQK